MYIFRGAESKNKLYYCDLQKLNYKIEGIPKTLHECDTLFVGILPMVKLIDDDFESSYDVRIHSIKNLIFLVIYSSLPTMVISSCLKLITMLPNTN